MTSHVNEIESIQQIWNFMLQEKNHNKRSFVDLWIVTTQIHFFGRQDEEF